jgi:multimeric flavodoxin WrbA
MRPVILGIAASLRNARWGAGNRRLVADLESIQAEADLKTYLREQADLHLQNFVEAGRKEGHSFDRLYANLKKLRGERGLSNSEVALAAALWSAGRLGCTIDHVSLAEYFPAADKARNLDDLAERVRRADGIVLSTPVYFGDRSSLVQDFVDFVRDREELRRAVEGKVFAGIAVGAKRNGGQETTLIYQLLDMVHLGLLGVGNDSDTTAQYGGTGHAGDVGTMAKDEYGVWTSMGAGRRVGHVATLAKLGRMSSVRGKVRVAFWILQDRGRVAFDVVHGLASRAAAEIEPTVIDAVGGHVSRCIACDICPTHVDLDQEYRCIIRKGGKDRVGDWHEMFLDQDAIVPVVLSSPDRAGLSSNYQTFIERTRYLRRGDYLFSDLLAAPLVVEDIGAHENMAVRMATSMIRHHTVLTAPMVLYRHAGVVLNGEEVAAQFERFTRHVRTLTAGRLRSFVEDERLSIHRYHHVGYVLAAAKDAEDEKMKLRERVVSDRHQKLAREARERLVMEPSLQG